MDRSRHHRLIRESEASGNLTSPPRLLELGVEKCPAQEVDQEGCGDDIECRMDLPSLAARQLDQHIADETSTDTVRDAESLTPYTITRPW